MWPVCCCWGRGRATTGQGNTIDDGKSWQRRIFAAVCDCTADDSAPTLERALGVDPGLLSRLTDHVNEKSLPQQEEVQHEEWAAG